MEDQTAVRHGDYKLVLNGRLTEADTPSVPVWLSDLSSDPGERNNLSEDLPDVCRELTSAATEWRRKLEDNWEERFAKNYSLTL